MTKYFLVCNHCDNKSDLKDNPATSEDSEIEVRSDGMFIYIKCPKCHKPVEHKI